MIKIRQVDPAHKADILLPNEPFPLLGKMIPSYVDETWRYRFTYLEGAEVGEMCFPDEDYCYEAMQGHSVFLGAYASAYDGANGAEHCVGLAILQDDLFRYMYLYDLKVVKKYRRQGVASALMEQAAGICRERGYRGLYTRAQDNNLPACRFYLKAGFHIGGLDTNVYQGTKQEGKADILFYRDC